MAAQAFMDWFPLFPLLMPYALRVTYRAQNMEPPPWKRAIAAALLMWIAFYAAFGVLATVMRLAEWMGLFDLLPFIVILVFILVGLITGVFGAYTAVGVWFLGLPYDRSMKTIALSLVLYFVLHGIVAVAVLAVLDEFDL